MSAASTGWNAAAAAAVRRAAAAQPNPASLSYGNDDAPCFLTAAATATAVLRVRNKERARGSNEI